MGGKQKMNATGHLFEKRGQTLTLARYVFINLYLAVASVAFLICAECGDVYAAEFKKTNCWFEMPRDRAMTCGTLNVPENRKKETSNQVVLSVVVFEPDRERHEPIVFLTGGPGQPAEIGSSEEIDSWWEFIGAQSWMIGRRVVVVDQRGIGKSAPALDCSQYFEPDHWNGILSNVGADNSFGKVQRKELVACRTALIAKGIDLDAYNTEENAEDINDLRRALGIEKWVLYGVSYGTRLALEVMNQHPEGVSASVLDSVVPLDVNYLDEDGPNLERSLKVLERDCQKANSCIQDLPEVVKTIARQLDRQPLFLRSAEKQARYTYVSGADFLDLIFGMLYDRDAISTLPELIRRTYEQDFRPLAEISFEADDLEISQGMDYSVTCSDSDLPNLSGKQDQYWAKWVESDDYSWACPLWILESGPASQKRPHRTDIPTLLLSGEYDPATPTEWANHAAETLPFGQVVVFRGIGHDVIDSDPCGSKVAADFLANPRRKLATECIDQMEAPQFVGPVGKTWSGVEAQNALSATTGKHIRLPFRAGRSISISSK
ncbi:alpha/beta hydrolase [Mesorhizobium sp. VK9D]|uniref:alpha/beta hydrolase n=1 Tax=Mesorhizobium australafricanum TaxID=3072311 RepID=UPI002A24E0BD|nr:alpha/beta hydrolase [Mesorhizobium sp. VK9D]MDX8454666.1 alpha/beta hydrolase [Mesorhizobium sp. VK9D]